MTGKANKNSPSRSRRKLLRRIRNVAVAISLCSVGALGLTAYKHSYDVPHVTLLLFDGDGALVTTLRGVRESSDLRPSFRTLL